MLGEVAPERAGVASGMITAMLQIGSAVGAAVLGGVFFAALGPHPDAAAYLYAFRHALHALLLVLVACIALSLLFAPLHARRRRQALSSPHGDVGIGGIQGIGRHDSAPRSSHP